MLNALEKILCHLIFCRSLPFFFLIEITICVVRMVFLRLDSTLSLLSLLWSYMSKILSTFPFIPLKSSFLKITVNVWLSPSLIRIPFQQKNRKRHKCVYTSFLIKDFSTSWSLWTSPSLQYNAPSSLSTFLFFHVSAFPFPPGWSWASVCLVRKTFLPKLSLSWFPSFHHPSADIHMLNFPQTTTKVRLLTMFLVWNLSHHHQADMTSTEVLTGQGFSDLEAH